VAQDSDRWRALVNMAIQFRVRNRADLLTERLLASREGICSMELISRNCFFSVFTTILHFRGGLRECVGKCPAGDVPVSRNLLSIA
jgi:hypothetical protein